MNLPPLPSNPEHSYVFTSDEKRVIAEYSKQCYTQAIEDAAKVVRLSDSNATVFDIADDILELSK